MTEGRDTGVGVAQAGWHEPLPGKVPRPTAAPAVVAFGACFMGWGIVTSWVISAVGLVLFSFGIATWIKEMRLECQRSDES